MKFNLIIILLFIFSTTTFSQLDSSVIDNYYKKLDSYNQFNGNALITKDNNIIFDSSYGNLDLSNYETLSPQTQFYLGDISNQYISLVAVTLINEEKLSETDFKFAWPNLSYAVLSVQNGKADLMTSWRLEMDGSEKVKFIKETIKLEDHK